MVEQIKPVTTSPSPIQGADAGSQSASGQTRTSRDQEFVDVLQKMIMPIDGNLKTSAATPMQKPQEENREPAADPDAPDTGDNSESESTPEAPDIAVKTVTRIPDPDVEPLPSDMIVKNVPGDSYARDHALSTGGSGDTDHNDPVTKPAPKSVSAQSGPPTQPSPFSLHAVGQRLHPDMQTTEHAPEDVVSLAGKTREPPRVSDDLPVASVPAPASQPVSKATDSPVAFPMGAPAATPPPTQDQSGTLALPDDPGKASRPAFSQGPETVMPSVMPNGAKQVSETVSGGSAEKTAPGQDGTTDSVLQTALRDAGVQKQRAEPDGTASGSARIPSDQVLRKPADGNPRPAGLHPPLTTAQAVTTDATAGSDAELAAKAETGPADLHRKEPAGLLRALRGGTLPAPPADRSHLPMVPPAGVASVPGDQRGDGAFSVLTVDAGAVKAGDAPVILPSAPPTPPALDRSMIVHIAQVSPQPGQASVEITLSPEELGRVRMSLTNADGALMVTLTSERPETMDLLRRHASDLAQEYRSLGYDSVDFQFQQHSQQSHQFGPDGGADGMTAPPWVQDSVAEAYPVTLTQTGVDIRI